MLLLLLVVSGLASLLRTGTVGVAAVADAASLAVVYLTSAIFMQVNEIFEMTLSDHIIYSCCCALHSFSGEEDRRIEKIHLMGIWQPSKGFPGKKGPD